MSRIENYPCQIGLIWIVNIFPFSNFESLSVTNQCFVSLKRVPMFSFESFFILWTMVGAELDETLVKTVIWVGDSNLTKLEKGENLDDLEQQLL